MRKIMLELVILGLLLGCQGRKPLADAPVATTPPDSIHSSIIVDMQNTPGHGETLGIKTIQGKLYHTKGRIGEIAGMIIPPADLVGGRAKGGSLSMKLWSANKSRYKESITATIAVPWNNAWRVG